VPLKRAVLHDFDCSSTKGDYNAIGRYESQFSPESLVDLLRHLDHNQSTDSLSLDLFQNNPFALKLSFNSHLIICPELSTSLFESSASFWAAADSSPFDFITGRV